MMRCCIVNYGMGMQADSSVPLKGRQVEVELLAYLPRPSAQAQFEL